MIPVSAALDHVFALCQPLGTEEVDLRDAAGRVLARPATANRAQPPFSASAMDGYAVCDADGTADAGQSYTVIGEAAAGHSFTRTLNAGQAVRIFTGAPVPEGATRVIIQENITRDGDTITQTAPSGDGDNIRPRGGDFNVGDTIAPPKRLTPADLTLLAAMNIPKVEVARRPTVALIATGDELVMPGETPSPDQIIASNSFGLAAMIEAAGGIARMLPIARDSEDSLRQSFDLAAGSDMIVTIGGASVGDHDIVGKVAGDLGLERAFHKVAMRPGKPLMSGRIGGSVMLGLPGNPVASMVTGRLFVVPALEAMTGLPAQPVPRLKARLSKDISANGPREHYMRARLDGDTAAPFDRQDSSLMSILSRANALVVRAPHAEPARAGEVVEYVPF
ncbi:gephyrin-like molybdotransferase Glp [Celeribacter sp.]|uniref:molybdopterin molybdotransferase MoeA n=1 Tax=Celeribacter sp. TaxID=1890673 RepID=UPI003A94A305